MHGTLSPRFPPHAAALPTVSPATEPLTGFLAPPPDTDALPAWPGSGRAPGGAPTACGSRLLLLFQLSKGCQCERQLIWLQRLQKTLFDLCIQSQRTHLLAVCSPKLALVGATTINGIFSLASRVVQMPQSPTTSTTHDPLQ